MTLLAPIIARFGLHIGIAVGVLVAFFAWDSSRVQKGRKIERDAIEKRGAINADKAEKARGAVDRIPADRLRDKHFRD